MRVVRGKAVFLYDLQATHGEDSGKYENSCLPEQWNYKESKHSSQPVPYL